MGSLISPFPWESGAGPVCLSLLTAPGQPKQDTGHAPHVLSPAALWSVNQHSSAASLYLAPQTEQVRGVLRGVGEGLSKARPRRAE